MPTRFRWRWRYCRSWSGSEPGCSWSGERSSRSLVSWLSSVALWKSTKPGSRARRGRSREEAGIQIDPAGLQPYFFASTEPRPNRVLLFALAPALRLSDIPTFVQNHEVSERGVIFGTQGLDPLFAFALHLKVATRFFEERGIVGPHQFQRI
jgi:hypothetical protein